MMAFGQAHHSSFSFLNDLRTLRRLLLAERGLPADEESEVAAGEER